MTDHRPDQTDDSGAFAQALLAESAWVRRLAARLLGGDGADSEDLTQAVLAGAWEQRPPLRGGLRGWLTVVTRRLASRQRRSLARRPEPLEGSVAAGDDPADSVAHLEQHRWLVDRVLELPEPYRSAVVDRHLKERSVQQIAQARGVTPAAVRKQLSRAVEMLRQRVDDEPGGKGRARLLLLVGAPGHLGLPLPTAESTAPLWLTTALVMKNKLAIVATVLLVLATLVVIEPWRSPEEPAALQSREQGAAASVGERVQTGEGDVGAEEIGSERKAAAVSAPAAKKLSMRVVSADGAAIPDVFAALIPAMQPFDPHRVLYAMSDDDGVFSHPFDSAAFETAGWHVLLAAAGRSPLFEPIALPAAGDVAQIVYGGRGAIAGHVRMHSDWQPTLTATDSAAPTRLSLSINYSLRLHASVREQLRGAGFDSWGTAAAVVDADSGRFRFEGLPEGETVVVQLPRRELLLFHPDSGETVSSGMGPLRGVRLPVGTTDARLLTFPVPGLRGRVVFPDGSPAVGAEVSLRAWLDQRDGPMTSVLTDADGRFSDRMALESVPVHRWLEVDNQPRVVSVNLWCSHDAAVSSGKFQHRFPAGARVSDLGDIVLQPLTRVHLLALSDQGTPAAGVRFASGRKRSRVTDATGRTSLFVRDPADMSRLQAGGNGFLVDWYPPSEGSGSVDEPFRVGLRRANELCLKLASSHFEPEDFYLQIEGPERLFTGTEKAQVMGSRLHWPDGEALFRSGGHDKRKGVTRRNGGFRKDGTLRLPSLVPDQRLLVRLFDRGGQQLLEHEVVTPPLGQVVEVPLVVDQRSCRIRGRVVAAAGRSAKGARVIIGETIQRGSALLTARAYPDKDGRFELTLLATERAVPVKASLDDHAPYVDEVRLVAGEVDLELFLQPAFAVTARVERDGKIVEALLRASQGEVDQLQDGSFRVSQLPTGSVTLTSCYAGRTFTKTVDPTTVEGPIIFAVPQPQIVPVRVPAHVATDTVLVLRGREPKGGGGFRVQLQYVDGAWAPAQIPVYPGRYQIACGPYAGDEQASEWVVGEGAQAARWVMQ